MNLPKENTYVLISPARNEGAYLPALIESVIAQTILPLKWIIVSDGSTDDTDRLASEAARQHGFIKLIRTQPAGARSFGAKARAFQRGCVEMEGLQFAFIGNLDADVTFGPGYYARMLNEMEQNPRLGVASGVCWDKRPGGFKLITISLNHSVGAVQFFRRECFEQIGGYKATTVGGVDSLAELTARMKGWETRAFPDLPFYHHKPVDSGAARTAWHICYRAGMTEYHIGTHPLFAFAKAIKRWQERPLLLSCFIRLYGYGRLWAGRCRRDAPPELVEFLKHEQLSRLRDTVFGSRVP